MSKKRKKLKQINQKKIYKYKIKLYKIKMIITITIIIKWIIKQDLIKKYHNKYILKRKKKIGKIIVVAITGIMIVLLKIHPFKIKK